MKSVRKSRIELDREKHPNAAIIIVSLTWAFSTSFEHEWQKYRLLIADAAVVDSISASDMLSDEFHNDQNTNLQYCTLSEIATIYLYSKYLIIRFPPRTNTSRDHNDSRIRSEIDQRSNPNTEIKPQTHKCCRISRNILTNTELRNIFEIECSINILWARNLKFLFTTCAWW